jgi:hypothetical protein
VLPALEGLGVLGLDLGQSLRDEYDVVRVAVERRIGQLVVQDAQFAFQRLDPRRQRLQLSGLLERELPRLAGLAGFLVELLFVDLGLLGLGCFLALLPAPVLVAADVFFDRAVAREDPGAGDDVVEKRRVVADQQHGPLEVDQQLFEQFQRLAVQIVGRLVEDQEVGGLGEELGQQQPVAFPAGEAADARLGPLGREKKVLEIADDVLALGKTGAKRGQPPLLASPECGLPLS